MTLNLHDSDAWLHWGNCLLQAGKKKEAIALIDKAIKLDPTVNREQPQTELKKLVNTLHSELIELVGFYLHGYFDYRLIEKREGIIIVKGEWGFLINPQSFLTQEIDSETEMPNGTVIVKKTKEYVRGVGNTVKTSYYLVQGAKEQKEHKNVIIKYLAEKMVEYMDEHSKWAPHTSLKNKYKASARLNYQPNKYDSFGLFIKEYMLRGRPIDNYLANLAPYSDEIETHSKNSIR
ncbi:MAG: tetratricopeptide repeat protein [Candidatus Heimdallarchaeota archaeon]